MFWHPERKAISVNEIFRIPAKQTALTSVWQWAAGAEQCEQAEECNVFVHKFLSYQPGVANTVGASFLGVSARRCSPAVHAKTRGHADARKSLFRSRWHLKLCRIVAACHGEMPSHAHMLSHRQPCKKRLRESMRAQIARLQFASIGDYSQITYYFF